MIHVIDPIFHDYLSFEHNTQNLYFCYRWLLVALKREFGMEGVKRVWEVCWASECSNYVLFVALALIYHEKEHVMDDCPRFEDILSVKPICEIFLALQSQSRNVGRRGNPQASQSAV